MLGGNEFRLRQGFGLRPKHLHGAKAPPARRPVGDSLAAILLIQNIDFARPFLFGFRRPEGGSTL